MAPKWKGSGKGQTGAAMQALGAGDWEGTAEGAIWEITEQLSSPGNDGRVWVKNWGRKYQSTLGNMREFVESQTDHFQVIQGEGRKFTVSLNGVGGKKKPAGLKASAKVAPAKAKAAAKGGKGAATAQGGIAWAALANGSGWGSGAKGPPAKGAGKGKANNWLKGQQQQDQDPMARAAIGEITDQLRMQGNHGHVWVEQWGQRYQERLGSLREFLESRPDKFVMYQGQGRKFTVGIATGGMQAQAWATPAQSWGSGNKRKADSWQNSAPAKKAKEATLALPAPKKEETEEELTEAAVKEVKKQLQKPNANGQVWIKSWPRRFGKTLGLMREFLESHPEHFDVIPGEGKKFTVEVMSSDDL